MTKKLPAEVKQSRKPTRVACAFCHSKHLQCDSLRPCKNCVKRGLGDSCCDAVRKKKGKRSSQETKRSSQSTSGEVSCGDKISGIELPVSSSTSSSLDATISTVPTVGTTEGSVTARSDNKDDSRVQNQMISIGNLNHSVGDHTSSTSGVPNPEIHQNQNSNVSDQTANNDSKPKKRGRPPGSKSSTNKPRKQTKISNDKNQNHNQNKTKTKSDDRNDEHTIKNKLHIDTVNSKDEETVVENKLMTTPILPLPSLSANTSHLPLLNLANATLSQLNLNQFLRPETPHNSPNASHSHTLSDFKLPSFSDLKNAPLFSNLNLQGLNEGLSNSKPPQFDVRLTTFSPVIGDVKSNPSTPGLNILSNGIPNLSSAGINNLLNMHRENKDENNNSNNSIIENPQPIDKKNMIESITVTTNNTPMNPPVSPGSPLEFSVSNNSRTDTNANSHHSSFAERSLPNGGGNRVTPQEVISSGSSIRNFESAVANDEYVKLTDLLNDNVINKTKLKLSKLTRAISPPMDNESFLKTISPNQINFHGGDIEADDELDEDEDNDSRPFIIINLEDNSMISSYKNNSTPNSFLFNPDHSQMTNTAKQIPSDFQQDEDYTSPLIMRHMIKQPDDIYLTSVVKAYQYPKAYHALIAYLKKRFNKIQLIEIAKCMARYRPSFISATKSLYENDLIFTERSFQRTLLEYENLISMSTSPTIIWRRTGEIVALTNEFAIMTGYSKMSLLSKRTFIVELMDDESTINYFRSFSDFAFGDLNATHLTDCNLRKAEDDNYLRCACVWTIKRDVFDIPMLIVGQFLPVLE